MKCLLAIVAAIFLGMLGCGEPRQAPRAELAILVDGTSLEAFETDLGYQVELENVALKIRHMEFTVGGQSHGGEVSSLRTELSRLWISEALAHPNHSAGGQVGGALPGEFLLLWQRGVVSQVASGEFIHGDYQGYNLDFSGASGAEHGEFPRADPGDGLMGSMVGVARPVGGGEEIAFEVTLEYFDDAQIIGGALSGRVEQGSPEAVALEFLPSEDWSGRTIFDAVEFSELPADAGGVVQIEPGSVAHARIRTAVTSHEHYSGYFVVP